MAKALFRLGSTSYVYPDDILPNVRQLAPLVDDVELVLFELDAYSNLPDGATLEALQRLAADHCLTYTVHLPLDLCVMPGDPSLEVAQKIMRLVAPLAPYAYVAHLDAQRPLATGDWESWRETSIAGLCELGQMAGGVDRVAIENLERWPLEEMYPILERIPVSFCLDIGHLWLAGLDVAPYVASLAPRLRVVHLHGIAERDHQSLVHMPAPQLSAALEALHRVRFGGVVTLEVFSVDDFYPSRDLVVRWMAEQ